MIFGFEITIPNILTFVGLIVGFTTQWVVLKSRSENNSLKIETSAKRISTLEDGITNLKLKMAEDFAPKSMIHDVETRILDRMTEQNKSLTDSIKSLTEEFREVRRILMER